MILTRRESKKIKALLPKDAVNKIYKDLGGVITVRMIQLIIKGEATDRHGVIEKATELALTEKRRRDSVKKSLRKI